MSEQKHDYGVTGGGPVMSIFAHPDDPEFVAGGALALWARAGRKLVYVICTDGSKGSSDRHVAPADLIKRRQEEQIAAARVLGSEDVVFLPYADAMLEPTLDLRRDLVRQVRKYKPQIVVCFDPTVYWVGEFYIQHPDHRASGEAALAAIFPSARDPLTFPELLAEGLEPHAVEDIYLASPAQPNRWLDISEVMDKKLEAGLCHKSQFADADRLRKWQRGMAAQIGKSHSLAYAEAYRFISFNTPRPLEEE